MRKGLRGIFLSFMITFVFVSLPCVGGQSALATQHRNISSKMSLKEKFVISEGSTANLYIRKKGNVETKQLKEIENKVQSKIGQATLLVQTRSEEEVKVQKEKVRVNGHNQPINDAKKKDEKVDMVQNKNEDKQTVEPKKENEESNDKKNGNEKEKLENSGVPMTELTISAAGDITIGMDESFAYAGSFTQEFDKHKGDTSYFIKGIQPIFEKDDLTIANLETTLTKSSQKAPKKFRFKGDPSYVDILKDAGIESVNIANNHIHDYLNKGFTDTIKTLEQAQIGYFGYQYKQVTNVKGISIGMLGYEGWDYSVKGKMKEDILQLKKQADLVIVSFHWGIERANYPSEVQKKLGHYAIDQGADLVLGHHPHVVQGIEEYNGRYIVYSLGNFLFGGNRNPSDKDTFVFQQTFQFNNEKKLLSETKINVIPFSISSTKSRNNYQPTKLEGNEKARVLERIQKYSKGM